LSKRDLFVTSPHLPPLDDLIPLLAGIWDRNQLTNRGPLVQQFEEALRDRLCVPHVTLCGNGTLALLVALRAMNLPGGSEVITSPYSFVATASAIIWAGLKPVFADVSAGGFNLDPQSVERAVSSNTSAILPVHCYGTPCDGPALQQIADKHDLKLVYDAAHAMGCDCDCGEMLTWGDASTMSFHATKVFSTFEGGCVVTSNEEVKRSVDQLINFGFRDETHVDGIGINGKMSEFNAAVGLLQLDALDELIAAREHVYRSYRECLSGLPGLELPHFRQKRSNYGYFPVLVGDAKDGKRDALYHALKSDGIHTRRYFYPLIPEFPDYREFRQADGLARARDLAGRVLCLPIYPALTQDDVARVCDAVAAGIAGV
jgi:dTDP-4-amino-4,6-dideoxygalactose transaminase